MVKFDVAVYRSVVSEKLAMVAVRTQFCRLISSLQGSARALTVTNLCFSDTPDL